MEHFVKRLDKAYDAIDYADYILVGAGAGFSAAAGIEYSGKRFEDNFKDFIEKYGLTDMYSSGFYPFKTSEEKWAYWSRHVYMNRYSVGKTELYEQLLELVRNKDYFILTTNVEHQFWINGFEDDRIFATQGDYGLFQCSELYPMFYTKCSYFLVIIQGLCVPEQFIIQILESQYVNISEIFSSKQMVLSLFSGIACDELLFNLINVVFGLSYVICSNGYLIIEGVLKPTPSSKNTVFLSSSTCSRYLE